VLTEMLARVFKNGIRQKMRKTVGVRPCKEVLCSYLASVFGVNSNEFWRGNTLSLSLVYSYQTHVGEGLNLLKAKYPFPTNRVIEDMESIAREDLFERLKALLGLLSIQRGYLLFTF